MSAPPLVDWEHVEWLRSFNRSWDTIARDLGVDVKKLVDAYTHHVSRKKTAS